MSIMEVSPRTKSCITCGQFRCRLNHSKLKQYQLRQQLQRRSQSEFVNLIRHVIGLERIPFT